MTQKNKTMNEIKTKHFQDLLKRFDVHILSTKSIKTGNHYTTHVEDFLKYLEQRDVLSLKRVDTSLMKDYFNHLILRPKKRSTGTISTRTVNDNLSTLRSFSLRMQEEDVITKGVPIPVNIKIEKDEDNPFTLTREILTTDEVKEVFEACQNETERALIALAYGGGLRRSTLVGLTENQIDFRHGLVTASKAKNNKTRQVPTSDFFLKVLKNYSTYRLSVLSRNNLRTKSYFINENGKAYTGDRLNRLLKKVIARTQNQVIIDKNITLHCLRHSIATHLMDAGESFEYVKAFLGHSMADTSLIYARRRRIKNYYAI